MGRKVLVIGVLKKEGKGSFDFFNLDEVAIMPLQYYKGFIDIRSEYVGSRDLGSGKKECERKGTNL